MTKGLNIVSSAGRWFSCLEEVAFLIRTNKMNFKLAGCQPKLDMRQSWKKNPKKLTFLLCRIWWWKKQFVVSFENKESSFYMCFGFSGQKCSKSILGCLPKKFNNWPIMSKSLNYDKYYIKATDIQPTCN